MRYQLRLLDETLPGLTRALSLRGLEAAEELLEPPSRSGLYRELYRGLRHVFERRFQANLYCGGAMTCEQRCVPTLRSSAPS